MSMSRRVYLGPHFSPGVRLQLFIYDVCPGNFVTFVLVSLSQRECPGLLSPPPCPGVWKMEIVLRNKNTNFLR